MLSPDGMNLLKKFGSDKDGSSFCLGVALRVEVSTLGLKFLRVEVSALGLKFLLSRRIPRSWTLNKRAKTGATNECTGFSVNPPSETAEKSYHVCLDIPHDQQPN